DFVYNQTVQKVTHDIETFGMNTAISQLMIFVNEAYKAETLYKEYALGFIKMLACFAPHLGEELYEIVSGNGDISYEPWPTFDPSKLVLDELEIVVQINGKVRAKFVAPNNLPEDELKALVYDQAQVQKNLEGMTVIKEIVIKNKIVNLVVKPN
ncbi:class I tRNA ligase family protein, partial [Erysipelothrix rhusiopathiae]|nr:class I tRNA ligase family protein [Erysipelothrix rhusiopathiae]MDE8160165.1 class I tRNA ligase family protein [Erysipelothrix rhusiopathiae]